MSNSTKLNDRDLDLLDIEEIKNFLVRRWGLIVAVALGSVMLAATVCLVMTPVYTATSQVLLDPHKEHAFGEDTVNQDPTLDSTIADSQIPIITSTRLLAKIVAKEHLIDDPEFAGKSRMGLFTRLFGLFAPRHDSSARDSSLDGIDPKLAPAIQQLYNKIDVTRIAKSYVLAISVSSRDPAKAMRLSNSLAQTYVDDQIDVHSRSVQQTATFFEQHLGRLRDQVRESERAVVDFRKANKVNGASLDGKSTVGEQQLLSLNSELARISADTAEKFASYQQGLRFTAAGANLESLPEIMRSPVITQLRGQQAELERREADLAAMYGPAHPAITQIRAQHIGLDRAISAEMRRVTAMMKNDYDTAKAREISLRKTIAALSDVSGGDSEVGVKLRELERANLANKALFENFLKRAKLTQEQSNFEDPDARLISPALEPAAPSSPNTRLILAVSGVAGLLLGLGVAALIDGRRVRPVVAPMETKRQGFIMARIPTVGGIGNHDNLAAQLGKPGSDFARSIGALVETFATSGSGPCRIATLVPLSGGVGATSLAFCLAEAAGASGRRVLLIDADQGRQGLSRFMNVVGSPGLAEVVAQQIPVGHAVVRCPRFVFLPVGAQAFEEAPMKRLSAFLTEARSRFDLVLIDAPAFAANGDAALLGQLSDSFAFVASREQLTRDAHIAAIESVADLSSFAGIILNREPEAERERLDLAS